MNILWSCKQKIKKNKEEAVADKKIEVKKHVYEFLRNSFTGEKYSEQRLVNFEIKDAVGYDEAQKKALITALNYQRQVLCSQEFKDRFLELKCTQTNGLTLQEVYDKIISGKNNLDKTEDFDLDYFLTLYDGGAKGTLGYTSMSTGRIYTNRAVFNSWVKNGNFASIASHLFHEYLHSMGFIHKWDFGNKRNSLVYRGGYLMRDMVQSVHDGNILLTPVKVS